MALSSTSASIDNTIKLQWVIESCQLLASFDVQNPSCIVLSPNYFLRAHQIERAEEHEWIMMAIMNIGAALSPHATPTTHHLFSFYTRFSFFFYHLTNNPKLPP